MWAFDFLAHNGKDLRKWSLEARQARLQALLSQFGCSLVLARKLRRPGAVARGREMWSASADRRLTRPVPAGAGDRLARDQSGTV